MRLFLLPESIRFCCCCFLLAFTVINVTSLICSPFASFLILDMQKMSCGMEVLSEILTTGEIPVVAYKIKAPSSAV